MTLSEPLSSVHLNPFQKAGFALVITYLFLVHARVLDKLYFLHLSAAVYGLAVVSVLLTGGFLRVFFSSTGVWLLALTGWMCLAAGSSVWVGGSVETLREDWSLSLMMFVLTAGLILNYRQCRKAMHTMAYAVFTLSIVSFIFGEMHDGRLVIPYSRFANPNELGQMLVIGFAFWWYIITDPTLSRARRSLAVLATVPMLIAAARTGSRATFVGFGVLLFQLFWKVSIGSKIKLILVAVTTLALAAALLPKPLRDRYFTLFQPKTAEELTEEGANPLERRMESQAVGSSWARRELLLASIRMTLERPFLGVGSGMFRVAEDMDARASGQPRGMWQLTHNTYTEYSSENGIPALLFYLAALFGCFRLMRSLTRRGRALSESLPPSSASGPRLPGRQRPGMAAGADIANAAFCLNLALTSYAVAGLFGSFAYHMYFPTLAGLIVAWHLAVSGTGRPQVTRRPAEAVDRAALSQRTVRPNWARPVFLPHSSFGNLPR